MHVSCRSMHSIAVKYARSNRSTGDFGFGRTSYKSLPFGSRPLVGFPRTVGLPFGTKPRFVIVTIMIPLLTGHLLLPPQRVANSLLALLIPLLLRRLLSRLLRIDSGDLRSQRKRVFEDADFDCGAWRLHINARFVSHARSSR